jgi:diguanylate cyclase (GGDEF)-like protein/PAS domain S-box-containing protein
MGDEAAGAAAPAPGRAATLAALNPMDATTAREFWRSAFDLYRSEDPEAGRIRAHHIGTVMRLVPALLLANIVNGVIVLVMFAPAGSVSAWLWSVGLVGVAAAMLQTWLHWRRRQPASVSRRALRRAALQAAALALLWGLVPVLWFDGAAGPQHVLLATIITGMMSGGAFVLVPLPASALAFVAVMALCSLVALLRHPQPAYVLTSVLVATYAAVLSLGALAGARKATALLRSQHEAARQRGIVSVLLHDFESHAAEALWETGPDGLLTHVSPRLAELVDADAATLRSAPLLSLLRARSPQAADTLAEAQDLGRPFSGLQLEVGDDGGRRWWSISGKPLFDDTGRPQGWRGVIADVTAEVRAQHLLRHQAHHDSLTGLANRLTLHERLREQLASGRSAALLVIDLDHFKAVNDSMGHSTGDALLKVVAVRLSACVRPTDVVARLGGDEFAMLVTSACGPDEALHLAQRVVAALQEPCEASGRLLRVGASVGVALLPEHGHSADQLFGHADMALYEAKEQGRGRSVVFSARLGDRSRRRVDLELGLRRALDRGEMAVHWQPQVDIRHWRVAGAEALLRWQHPQLGAVGPSEFVAVAESCGLIEELGHWVLDQACRTAATRLQGLSVSVNVSAAQLRDERFAEHVRAALHAHQLDPSRLELEITESIFIDDAQGAIQRLQALRELGVRIGLDDFGTGYSSLAYLRRFPFDTLKIDRAFVSELLLRGDAQAIVRTITQLAGALGMRTVAEGVETEAQLAVAEQTGCNQVQGYLVSPPRPLDEFVALRQGWRGRPASSLQLH